MIVEQRQRTVDESQNWSTGAEERGHALAEAEARRAAAERACEAWMMTAQMAEDWADQLGKVRLWLQEQLLAQSEELNEAQHQKEQALAELAALQAQCEAAQKALVQKHEELCLIEQSTDLRLLRWVRRNLVPPQTLRARLLAKSVRVTLRLLRRPA